MGSLSCDGPVQEVDDEHFTDKIEINDYPQQVGCGLAESNHALSHEHSQGITEIPQPVSCYCAHFLSCNTVMFHIRL